MERTKYRNVTYLSPIKPPEAIDIDFMDARLFFCFVDKDIKSLCYEEIIIPANVNGVDVFYDDTDKKIYLTNFVYLEELLNVPVDAIIVYEKEIQILVGTKCLNFYTKKLPEKFLSESFIYQLYGISHNEISTERTHQKGKTFVESQDVFNSDDSQSLELGVVTHSGSSYVSSPQHNSGTSIPSPLRSEDIIPTTSSYLTRSPVTNERNPRSAKHIKITGSDRRVARKDEVQKFRGFVDGILLTERVRTNEISVPAERLIPSMEIDVSDVIVQRMFKELQNERCLVDVDPIVVIENGDKFLVLSGNRKVAAYKEANKKTVYVSRIAECDRSAYMLQNYLLNKTDKDTKIGYLIYIVECLLKSISLSEDVIKSWTTNERNYVFHSLCTPMSSLRHIIDIFVIEDLRNGVKFQIDEGISLSNHTLRDLSRKYKCNPSGIRDLLNTKWNDSSELRKSFETIGDDVAFLLKDKGVTDEIADDLSVIYDNDTQFADFVRGMDRRCYNKNKQKESIISKFDEYKLKKLRDRKRPNSSSPLNVELGRTDTDFDLLLTSDRIMATNILKQKNSIFLIYFGPESFSENTSLLMLPDKLAIEDEFGKLINELNISFTVKKDGNILNRDEFFEHCRQYGLMNRSIFSVSQLREYSNIMKKVYADVGENLGEELVLSVISEGSTVFVKTMKNKRNILTIMKAF